MNRIHLTGHLSMLLVLLIACPETAFCQGWTGQPTNSASLEAGMFWPVGEWKKHRFARGVDQFQQGPAFGIELEHRFSESVGLALMGTYASLGVSDWEDYARSRGDQIKASSFAIYVGVRMKFYLLDQSLNRLKVGFGILYLNSGGSEEFKSFGYNYDFFDNNSAAFLAGAEYERSLSDIIAVTAKVDVIILPSGVEYASGGKYLLVALPTMFGMRFFF